MVIADSKFDWVGEMSSERIDQNECSRGWWNWWDGHSYFAVIWMMEEIGKCKIVWYNTSLQMDSTTPLYATHIPPLLGRLLVNSTASKLHDGEVNVVIYEHFMVESSPKGKHYMPFDFDLKFGFQTSPPSIFFEKGQEKVMFTLKSDQDLQTWREALKDRINQRGFHEQFKPKKKIGKGNFASVYLAEKLETGRNYAVKAFSKEAAYSEDKGKECLIKEIQIMRALNHRNCMKLFQVFESDNSLYIVVELLEGGLIYDKIKAKEKFKPQETKQIMFSILSGLREMHSKRIMHRDLKPENLIFRTPGSSDCVIADFGLAEFADSEEYLFVRCGTPGYVAPEVINIKDMKTKYEPICDLFSLGLIFHILLLGVSAFPGKTYNEVLKQNRESHITFEGRQYDALDANALTLLKKLLKSNPQERITASEALNHPYFNENMEDIQELDTVPALLNNKNYPSCDSPLLMSGNPARRNDKGIKKDSCVDFKMGRENVFTGKVETVVQTGSTHNSVGKRFESLVSPKASKFSTRK